MASHSFDIALATELGSVELAILYNHIEFWCIVNAKAKRNIYDDHVWTYNSAEAIAENFPYWSGKKVRRLLDALVKKGKIRKGNYNKTKFDRTCWYGIHKREIHFPDLGNGKDENGNGKPESGKPIPDTEPGAVPNSPPSEEKGGKPAHTRKKVARSADKPGAVQRREKVHTTDDEHAKLQEELGGKDLNEVYDILENYKQARGKEYASDYHAIRKWVIGEQKRAQRGDRGLGGMSSRPKHNTRPDVDPEHFAHLKGKF